MVAGSILNRGNDYFYFVYNFTLRTTGMFNNLIRLRAIYIVAKIYEEKKRSVLSLLSTISNHRNQIKKKNNKNQLHIY